MNGCNLEVLVKIQTSIAYLVPESDISINPLDKIKNA